jgi:putative YhdH/YhfP family quinone oxidoreductase
MTMETTPFRALVVEETGDKQYVRRITTRTTDELPAGEVLVRVHYSSLNYKDALSAIGNRGVTRRYPHTPGIDAAGVVAESGLSEFPPGTPVIVCCYDLGMNTPGGFGEYIRVPAAWVMPCPEGLTLKESMVYGTAWSDCATMACIPSRGGCWSAAPPAALVVWQWLCSPARVFQ